MNGSNKRNHDCGYFSSFSCPVSFVKSGAEFSHTPGNAMGSVPVFIANIKKYHYNNAKSIKKRLSITK